MNDAREFSSRLLDLLRREQSAMADFLLALADFDRRRLWVGLGYSSLFYFLHRELKLSSGAAYHRKTAAELIQRFPEVVEPLRDGQLCLSSVCELAKVMTRENRTEVLPRFFHASKQEAKAVAAEIAPREVLPQRVVVTSVAVPPQARAASSAPTALTMKVSPLAFASHGSTAAPAPEPGQSFHPGETDQSPAPRAAAPRTEPALPPPPQSTIEPLTADLRRLHITVSKRFLEKLDAAREALSHSHPGADAEAILEAGLDLLIERAAKRKGLCTRPKAEKPRASAAGEPDSGHIPAAVKREVWVRDGGCCQWPLDGGGICGSTHRLQFDHVVPRARGGKSTVAGVRVLCHFHNLLAARQHFGDEWMDRFTRGAARQPSLPAPPA